MTRPSLSIFVLGHPIILAALLLGFYGGLNAFLSGHQEGELLFIPCSIMWVIALRANRRVRAYRAWQREWRAMNAGPSTAPQPARPASATGNLIRATLAGTVWVLLALVAIGQFGNPQLAAVSWVFFGISGVAAAMWLFGRFTARRPIASAPIVTVCLDIPRSSETVRDAYAALPEHCWPNS